MDLSKENVIYDAQQDIALIESFDEIRIELDNANPDVLVIFDVDDVLIASEDMVLRPCGSSFRPQSWKDIDSQKVPHLLSIMFSESEVRLVESSASQLIKNLQNRRVKTLALTAARTGRFGVIDNAEDWRISVLKRFGIDFEKSFSTIEPIYFDKKASKKAEYSLFKSGVLFLGNEQNTKGELLAQFLTKLKWKPKKVIFLDDRRSNLISSAIALNQMNIPFQGYEYRGAWNLPGEFNEQVAEIQFAHLRKNHKWLSDSEARKEDHQPSSG